MALGEIGATPLGGCNRQALTDGDLAGRRLFADWAAAAGCRVRVDAIGNLFVHRAGLKDTFPVVLTGSHLDTQPTGGKFDGVYGVLAGLEVIEALNDAGMSTVHPIEVGVWCNEEGCRFPMAMMGSAVWSGRLPLDTAHALTDRSGRSVRQELERLGIATDAKVPRQSVKAALEVHIEQGPVLETAREDHRHRDRGATHEPARSRRPGSGSSCGTHPDGHAARSRPSARGSFAGDLRGGA